MAVIAAALIVIACVMGDHVRAALPPLERSIQVRFALADGIRVQGQMTSCDEFGFEGSFGRREWTDLAYDDAWTLHQRVMDSSRSADWINLGRVMLVVSDTQPFATQRAETAFRRARQIDEAAEDEIERVREHVAGIHRAKREAARDAEQQKLTTLSPEAGPNMRPGGPPWPSTAWPTLDDAARAAAVNTMNADAQSILKQTGASLQSVETANFLLFSEMDRAGVAELAVRLERVVTALHFVLNPGVDPAARDRPNQIMPWGKIAVFVWKDQDRFKTTEAESFGHLVSNSRVAITHYAGQRAFINAWRVDDSEEFEWAIAVEAVHALMHNFTTPRRLPAWANDGLAELIASRMNKQSLFARERRTQAVEFVRTGGNLIDIMRLRYEDGSFPGPTAIGSPVGGLILELMMNEKPVPLVRWMIAVKSGKDWVLALKDDYGSRAESIATVTTEYYLVND